MKIDEVHIKTFRSIKNSSFKLNELTAIVGENNAGKTSILRALNSFFNYEYEREYFINRRHQYGPHSNTYITIVFSDIDSDDIYRDYICNNILTIEFFYDYAKSQRRFRAIKGREKTAVEDHLIESISRDIKYIYIPAGRSNKDVNWSNDSIFQELIVRFTQENIIRDSLSSKVRSAGDYFHNKVLYKLEKEINALYLQGRNVDFRLGFLEGLDYKIFLDKINLSLASGEKEYLLQDWGSGTKSLAIIAMHRALAQLNKTSIVLGIEEPETNLHPQAQKRFIESLRDQLGNSESQTIFTTHSTVLVDELRHEDIVLVRQIRDSKRGEGFFSEVRQVPSDFWKIHGLSEEKPYQFFYYRNSDFFFAKYVVIGESKTDCQVLRHLIKPRLGKRVSDVSFLNADGVDYLIYPYFLLKELNIPFTIVVDKDFFFPYKFQELKKSRADKTGLPIYEYSLKSNPILDNEFNEAKKHQLVSSSSGFRTFHEELSSTHILSMAYCLEMDLTLTNKARQQYYSELNVPAHMRNQNTLLTQYGKTIKKIENIFKVLNSIPEKNYPESYLKIKNTIISRIEHHVPE